MSATPVAFATKDNASAQLQSGINASVLSIPLKSGHGANLPQPYNGTASPAGDSNTLNCTGILAAIGAGAAGKPIWNKTDGSVAFVVSVSTDSVETTRLLGGTDNTWGDADVWVFDPFVATFAVLNAGNEIDTYEQALIIGRSADTLTVAADGRGYNGTVANAFSADDHVYCLVTSPIVERLKDVIAVIARQQDADRTSIADFSSTASGKGASLIGVQDAAGVLAAGTVEAALLELYNLTLGFGVSKFGNGSDGALNVTSGTTTIDCQSQNIVLRQYTSFNVSAGATLAFSNVPSGGMIFVVLCQGNFTLAGTLNLRSCGADGGAGVSVSRTSSGASGSNGNPGTNPFNAFGLTKYGAAGQHSETEVNSGGYAAASGGGGSGNNEGSATASAAAATTSQVRTATAAAGGTALTAIIAAIAAQAGILVGPGAGGASAGVAVAVSGYSSGTFSATSGDGTKGGGALWAMVGGDFSFTGTLRIDSLTPTASAVVTGAVTGTNNGYACAAGGSSPGAAGSAAVFVKTGQSVTNSGTVNGTVTGGDSASAANGSGTGSTSNAAVSGSGTSSNGTLTVARTIP